MAQQLARFNIAAVPMDATLQDVIAKLAQDHFAAIADGYIFVLRVWLTSPCVPKFRATTEQVALAAFTAWQAKRDVSLKVGAFRLRAGRDDHAGKSWAYFSVERAPALLDLQSDCARHLVEAGLEILTPPETYSPHITLARLPGMPTTEIATPMFPYDAPVSFRPAVGRSSEYGVLLGTLGGGRA